MKACSSKSLPFWICQRTLAFLLLALTLTLGKAQEKEYLYEIGGGLGASWGYGDVNASKAVYNPSLDFGAIWRYNINLRWALATELQSDGIKGSTSDFDLAFPSDVDYSCRYWQIAVRPEIHFWNYGWGSDYREKKRYTPFLTLGLSAGVVTGPNDGSKFAWGIPMGIGYKFKWAKRWNTQVTCIITKSFSDELDGVKDPEGIKTSSLVDNDWVASLRLSVTFDFKERCVECHNQNYVGKK